MAGPGLLVLVTRPDGEATAARLRALGHQPVLLPLSRVTGLPPAPMPKLPRFSAVAMTSANAPRFADPALLAATARKPFFAVGAATAKAARQAGFIDVRVGPGDAEGLARQLCSTPGVSPLLYLCGRVRRPDFEDVLAANGIEVAAVETYDTLPLEPSSEAMEAALGGSPVDVVLLHSALNAQVFRRLRNAPPFARAAVFALSPRIAEAAGGGHAAARPNEEALLALFEAASFQSRPVW